ncbi:MAG: hypothetical protein VYA01_01895 [Bacteroidota bacterium]|nr:hypothetical protein [Bacteroidota bacterium]
MSGKNGGIRWVSVLFFHFFFKAINVEMSGFRPSQTQREFYPSLTFSEIQGSGKKFLETIELQNATIKDLRAKGLSDILARLLHTFAQCEFELAKKGLNEIPRELCPDEIKARLTIGGLPACASFRSPFTYQALSRQGTARYADGLWYEPTWFHHKPNLRYDGSEDPKAFMHKFGIYADQHGMPPHIKKEFLLSLLEGKALQFAKLQKLDRQDITLETVEKRIIDRFAGSQQPEAACIQVAAARDGDGDVRELLLDMQREVLKISRSVSELTRRVEKLEQQAPVSRERSQILSKRERSPSPSHSYISPPASPRASSNFSLPVVCKCPSISHAVPMLWSARSQTQPEKPLKWLRVGLNGRCPTPDPETADGRCRPKIQLTRNVL